MARRKLSSKVAMVMALAEGGEGANGTGLRHQRRSHQSMDWKRVFFVQKLEPPRSVRWTDAQMPVVLALGGADEGG